MQHAPSLAPLLLLLLLFLLLLSLLLLLLLLLLPSSSTPPPPLPGASLLDFYPTGIPSQRDTHVGQDECQLLQWLVGVNTWIRRVCDENACANPLPTPPLCALAHARRRYNEAFGFWYLTPNITTDIPLCRLQVREGERDCDAWAHAGQVIMPTHHTHMCVSHVTLHTHTCHTSRTRMSHVTHTRVTRQPELARQ